MADDLQASAGFTIYLEGHEGHQGNVLLHAFLTKIHRLWLVFNKLERVFIDSDVRQTDFEILNADKFNPTTLTVKPVPRVKAYNPVPAFDWGLEQIHIVARGGEPDERVRGDIARDLATLATKQQSDGYKSFWINGRTHAVHFDDRFKHNAERLAVARTRADETVTWHTGVSRGAVVGELKAVDDISDDREFVIVPPTGADTITCTFPAGMRGIIGKHLFQMVRVRGRLHYGPTSPFPFLVEVDENGIEAYPRIPRRKSMLEMRGVFAGRERRDPDLGDVLNG